MRITDRLAVSGAALVLLLTGCTSATGERNDRNDDADGFGPVSISGLEGVTADLNFELSTVTLPLDRFRVQTFEFQRLIEQTTDSLITSCLSDRGFETDGGWRSSSVLPPEDRRYGLWSISNASAFGYEFNPAQDKSRFVEDSFGTVLSSAFDECAGEAQETLRPQLEFHDSVQVDSMIGDQARARVLESAEGQALISTAMACIEQRGFALNDAGTEISSHYSDQDAETKAKVALAEATCFTETGAIQGLYDLEARYQTAYMAQSEAQLVALSERIKEVEDSLRAAAEK